MLANNSPWNWEADLDTKRNLRACSPPGLLQNWQKEKPSYWPHKVSEGGHAFIHECPNFCFQGVKEKAESTYWPSKRSSIHVKALLCRSGKKREKTRPPPLSLKLFYYLARVGFVSRLAEVERQSLANLVLLLHHHLKQRTQLLQPPFPALGAPALERATKLAQQLRCIH